MAPPSTFFTLTGQTFPFNRTITEAEFDGGTFADTTNECWFKYVPAQDEAIVGLIEAGGTFSPRIQAYESDALTLRKTINGEKSWFLILTGGTNYWFKLTDGNGGDTDVDIPTTWDVQPIVDTLPAGTMVINDDTNGFPGTAWQPDGTFVGFISTVPGGEMAASLPSGVHLWHDRFGLHGNKLALLGSDFSLITAFDLSPTLGSAFPLAASDGTDFYVVHSTSGAVSKVTAAGVVTNGVTQLPAGTYKAAGVSTDGTILYWAEGYDSAAIHRHDLVNDVALSDLYTVPSLVGGYVALTAVNEHPGDILVLSDDSVVTWYRDWAASPAEDVLLHLSAAGAVLHSYTYQSGTAKIDHIAYSPDDPDSVVVWFFLGGDFDDTRGRFSRVLLSDGSESPTFDTDLFSAGVSKVAGSSQLIGPSASCTILTSVYDFAVDGGGEDPPPGEVPPDPDPPPGPCCANNGPGGTPTDTGYKGGGPQGPGTSSPLPRKVPTGGPDPEYVVCASIGGTPATAADPSNAQDLTTCKTPLVHLKWTLPDGSIKRYGKLAFTSGNGESVSARVLKWGPVSQVLSDRHGSFQANQFTVTISDYDRALRSLLSTTSTKYIDGKEVEVLIESAANAALGVDPLVLSRGIVTKWRYNRDLTIDLTVTDPLGYRWSSVSLDRPIPHRVVRRELFPNCPENTTGRPMPIIYGEMSDDYTWSVQPDRIPVGICPVIYVGPANTIASGLADSTWHAFLIAGHAIPCVSSIFGSNLDTENGEQPIRMEAGRIGVEFLLPGDDAEPYYDITGTDGVTERVALMFARGPVADAHIEGRVPMTINVYGIEDVGDGTGDCITDLALQYQHFMSYWVVQNYVTGNWGSVPTFSNGTAKVRTSSFTAANTIHAGRLGGGATGYIGSMYIGDQKAARDWSREFSVSGDMRPGVNNHGQILVAIFSEQASTSGLTTFTDQDHVLQNSFEIEPDVDEIFNVYTYEYGPEPATDRVSGLAQTIRSPASITNHGERIAQALLYRGTRHKATADDVANRTMWRSLDPPTTVTFLLDLRGAALSLGQLIRVTHYQGIGVTGWTERVLMVTRITTHPDEDEFTTEIECEDVHELLVMGGEVVTLDAGQLDVSRVA